MEIATTLVGMLHCRAYQRQDLIETIERLCRSLPFAVRPGDQVLLKPNLVSGTRSDGLACTHPEFIAAAAQYFLDHGARVAIGDSPAFGTAASVMRACRITEALAGLPVQIKPFARTRPVRLASGVTVGIAEAALNCDHLINLPKVKVHGQLLLTLAVKNYFGTVAGITKPWWHLRHGADEMRFAGLIVDLLAVLPAGITLVDGVAAMHAAGPMNGLHFPLELVAGSTNPVAVDTALLAALKVAPRQSLLWRECARRGLAGVGAEEIVYPLESAASLAVDGFLLPRHLAPVSFNPARVMIGAARRLWAARPRQR